MMINGVSDMEKNISKKNISIIMLLRSSYNNMTKSEKKIADYILANEKSVMSQTISDLAVKAQSSEITVSRFCKKLGFNGLQSFKIALAGEVFSKDELLSQEINPHDSYKTIAEKLFSSIADGLQDTLKLLDFEEINKAVDLISKARQICVYGFGNSYTVCKDIETRFMRFGIPVKAYCDLHMQLTASSLLTQEDLIIAVSHTGSNIDLLQSIELAHDNKIPIIAITSYMNSPLCKLADVVLHGMGREVAYKSEAVASRLIHMAIVDVLYMGIYQHNVDKGFANIEKMRAAIAKRRL